MRYVFSFAGLALVILSIATCAGASSAHVQDTGLMLALTGLVCMAAGAIISLLERILARLPEK